MDGILKFYAFRWFTPAGVRRRPLTHLFIILLALGLIWQIGSMLHLMREDTWPPPSRIIMTLLHDLRAPESTEIPDQNRSQTLLVHLAHTLEKWFVGFAISVVAGIAIGTALGTSKTIFAVGHPVVSVLRALPSAAVWPICVLLVGMGFKSQLATIVFGAIWPVLLNTLNSLASLSPEIRDTMQFMQLSRPQRFLTQVQWALPGIFTGVELSCSVAFLLAVTVEVFDTSNGGIGWYMDFHKGTFEYANVFAGVLLTAFVGWMLNSAIHFVRRAVLFWEHRANTRRDLLPRRVQSAFAFGDTSHVIDSIPDERLRRLLVADDVTSEMTRSFGTWQLDVLYCDEPYFWPSAVATIASLANSPLLQREIRLIASLDGHAQRAVLFAQSWLNPTAFNDAARGALDAKQLTLGQIIREIDTHGMTLTTTRLEKHVSERIGMAFGINGAVEALKRTRTITRAGSVVGLIHEYVPVLRENTQVFA